MFSAKNLTYASLFIAFGLLLPQIFHLVGGTGPIFLPMHIPVLLAGFFLGGPLGALIGMITPVLSSLTTAMPQPPILYLMMAELTAYGFVSGWLSQNLKQNVLVSLIGAMLAGRFILALTVFILQPLIGLKLSAWVYLTSAVINGLPGIILQLLFIPALVKLLDRASQNRPVNS